MIQSHIETESMTIHNQEKFPLLSVVVPTLNRRSLLETTLNYLCAEMNGYESDVEFIVVDNASEDDTVDFLRSYKNSDQFRLVCFGERANIDDSFRRCIEVSNGCHINIFGDDDIPMSGFIKKTLEIIKSNDQASFIYFNRLIGDIELREIAEVAHPDRGFETLSFNIKDFIRGFTHHPSFISSLVFSRDTWSRGEMFYRNEYLGYKFLARIYGGSKDREIVYVGMPSLIQRRGHQSWKKDWPRYWLVNMPSLLSTFDDNGYTAGALDQWRRRDVSVKRLVIDCVVAKAYAYENDDAFWTLASRFQPVTRRWIMFLIRFLLPSALAKAIYFRRGKYRPNP